jgi:hypothetical protein
VLKTAVQTAIIGEGQPIPAAQRARFLQAVADTDLNRKLHQLVTLTCTAAPPSPSPPVPPPSTPTSQPYGPSANKAIWPT